MKTVKFKELPEKVREFLQREFACAFVSTDTVQLDWLSTLKEWSKATHDERLAYAEWRYKDGDTIGKWSGEGFFTLKKPFKIWEGNVLDQNGVCVYSESHSKFAEIIEDEVEEKEEEPTFKAGDEATLDGSDANTVFKIVHIQDGRAWIKTEGMMFGRLVMLYRLRKPAPDKVYIEIAKEILKKWDLIEDDGYVDPDVLSCVIEAIKKGKEL